MGNAEYVTGAGLWLVHPLNGGGPGWYLLEPGAFIVCGLPGLAAPFPLAVPQVVWD
jgi:hypothetical protein